jgi:pimeloyl-ACP methyl ester carboxylesterase
MVVATAIAFFCAGLVLSRLVEPSVRVEGLTLAGQIPALRFLSQTPGPHPTVLLTHGISASKETMYRMAEAICACGFECYAIDLPGHGASTAPWGTGENADTIAAAASAIGSTDIFVGHSMGAYGGAQALRSRRLNPRLFIAIGALPDLGAHSPPLLLLAGQFEEAVPLNGLRARTDAHVVVSPTSDHALEPYDPLLVEAAVDAACGAFGKTPVHSVGRWRWRLIGWALAVVGSLALGYQLPLLPKSSPAWYGVVLSILVIAAVALTSGSWLGAMPTLRRLPAQLAAVLATALVVVPAGRLRVPRWTFPALAGACSLSCLATGALFLGLFAFLFALVCLAGAIVARIADWRSGRSQGDVAFAVFVGYAMGQWLPLLY